MLDAFVARMAGGPQKQPRKLSFGVASGGDGVKRPLSYQIAQRMMGEKQAGSGQARPQTSNRRSKSSQSADGMMQDVMRNALVSVAKKK
jgi:hypothetical protein